MDKIDDDEVLGLLGSCKVSGKVGGKREMGKGEGGKGKGEGERGKGLRG